MGVSAKNVDRPAFQQMVSEVDRFERVLVRERSRYARDYGDASTMDKWFAARGVSVWSLNEPYTNGDDPSSFLVRGITDVFSAHYLVDLSHKVKAGHRSRASTAARRPTATSASATNSRWKSMSPRRRRSARSSNATTAARFRMPTSLGASTSQRHRHRPAGRGRRSRSAPSLATRRTPGRSAITAGSSVLASTTG